jgi:hypothetical protein
MIAGYVEYVHGHDHGLCMDLENHIESHIELYLSYRSVTS